MQDTRQYFPHSHTSVSAYHDGYTPQSSPDPTKLSYHRAKGGRLPGS